VAAIKCHTNGGIADVDGGGLAFNKVPLKRYCTSSRFVGPIGSIGSISTSWSLLTLDASRTLFTLWALLTLGASRTLFALWALSTIGASRTLFTLWALLTLSSISASSSFIG
tara:strand:- start:227 stop:562 length:336 start_codon:yes stop_codon:yes gene_type:complete